MKKRERVSPFTWNWKITTKPGTKVHQVTFTVPKIVDFFWHSYKIYGTFFIKKKKNYIHLNFPKFKV